MSDLTIKIILVGDSGVGKSSLLKTYMGEPFDHVYTSTVGVDFEIKNLNIDGKNVVCQIWDTAGQERFRTITTSYYRSSHAILLVYDVTDLSTFRSLDEWMADVCEYASPDVGILLCANKADSADREVSFEIGSRWAEANGMQSIETSALHGVNVDKAFEALARLAVERVQQRSAGAASADDTRGKGGKNGEAVVLDTAEPKRGCC